MPGGSAGSSSAVRDTASDRAATAAARIRSRSSSPRSGHRVDSYGAAPKSACPAARTRSGACLAQGQRRLQLNTSTTTSWCTWLSGDTAGATLERLHHIVGFTGFQITACHGGKDVEGVWRLPNGPRADHHHTWHRRRTVGCYSSFASDVSGGRREPVETTRLSFYRRDTRMTCQPWMTVRAMRAPTDQRDCER